MTTDDQHSAYTDEAGAYHWTGSQLVMTHCIHGLDRRLHPRCYLCRPEPSGIFATGGNLPTEHGYTCGECGWGRADQPRSLVEYVAHVNAEHPTGPHRDFGGDDPKSPFADLEDENADLRMALDAASAEIARLRGAASAVVDGWNDYIEAQAGRGHEGSHIPESTLEGGCGPCAGAQYGTEVAMSQYVIPALRAALEEADRATD